MRTTISKTMAVIKETRVLLLSILPKLSLQQNTMEIPPLNLMSNFYLFTFLAVYCRLLIVLPPYAQMY